MTQNDVSFWCIVLAIVVAMTFHHFFSSDIIEGQQEMEVDLNIDVPISVTNLEKKNEDLEKELKRMQEQMKISSEKCKNGSNKKRKEEKKIQGDLEASAFKKDDNTAVEVDVNGSQIVNQEKKEEEVEEEKEEIIIFEIDKKPYKYDITTCGKVGKDPPSKGECSKTHKDLWFRNKKIYDYDTLKGIHTWIVPKTGSYIIEAAGGKGGTLKDAEKREVEVKPGKGAVIKGIFYLKKGERYNIIIGQSGTPPPQKVKMANPFNGGAGGAGGTFMWRESSETPLIVAGGGGGQGITGHKILGYGGDGSLLENGTMGPTINKEGNRAVPPFAPNFGKEGEGGGDPSRKKEKSKGWNDLLKDKSMIGTVNFWKSEGGFGGGGNVYTHAGGGGGGYSGGGSLRYGNFQTNTMGGGGGGSYFNDNGYKREDSKTIGYNDGNGYIKIQLIKNYFLVEGTKIKCQDHGGYDPRTKEECSVAAKELGFEWKKGPRENGWNKDKCSGKFSKCIWREDDLNSNSLMPGCDNKQKGNTQGLLFNEKCKGQKDYKSEGYDTLFKTVCVAPIKALNENGEFV